MKSFNHRFNTCCMRLSFWQKLSVCLANIEALIRGQGRLTSDDVRILQIVRKAIKESYSHTKKAEEYHSRQLEKLRKEHLNEGGTINESCKY